MKHKSFTIHDLPKSERPRERLQKFGVEALSSQELLSLILGRGIPGESVNVTSQRLLSTFGNIKSISEASIEELAKVKGIGLAKAAQIKAAFELAKRKDEVIQTKINIESPQDTVNLVKSKLIDRRKEHFLTLSLDSRNNLIKVSEVSVGSLNASIVHPREVFREAIQSSAASVIMVHNHPSGKTGPSEEDRRLTKSIIDACELIGVKVLDHIFIGKNQEDYFSFAKNGLI